ncbi:Phosphopantetheine attachment site [Gammaproteobacteria bacterium MOLA455]|nr:Phosphopantetheine attachment site [Gammaproteobacteria bacterium MOLA455]
MSKLLDELKEIFEVDQIDTTLNFEELEEWDSLNALVLLGYLEDQLGTQMAAEDIVKFPTIGDFLEHFERK